MNPHLKTSVIQFGELLGISSIATVLVHGRGQQPSTMLEIARRLDIPGISYLALEAAGNTWYPESFLAPVEENQPYLDYAIESVGRTIDYLYDNGYDSNRVVLLGFSQGACLLCEFVFRHSKRWGGLISFTGGVIGAEIRQSSGCLHGTPVLISGSDKDEFVPVRRMRDTAKIFSQNGGAVSEHYYSDAEHYVSDEQIIEARTLITQAQNSVLLGRASSLGM